MKFAIRRLTISCLIPATLLNGVIPFDLAAQTFPGAGSKLSSGMAVRKSIPAQGKKPAVPTRSAVATGQTAPRAIRVLESLGSTDGSTPMIQTVAGPMPQQRPMPQQQAAPGNGGESDVQRQLRMLYEKSGQEMPVMDINEMEVPEPQAGVAPGSQPQMQDVEEGQQPATPQQRQYAQPPVPPPKAPNFFERVFLGKKAPPPQATAPRPQPGQIRPGQGYPNGAQPNYRPYQQPTQQQPTQQQPVPQQLPNGYNGQRPGMIAPGQPQQGGYPQGNGYQQPNGYPQQPQQRAQQMQPQHVQQPQRPPVVPPPLPQQNPQTAAQPQQGQPQGNTAQPPAQRQSELPLLSDEPEESLEIDLSPKANPKTATPSETAPQITPEPRLEARPQDPPRDPVPPVSELPGANATSAATSGIPGTSPATAAPAKTVEQPTASESTNDVPSLSEPESQPMPEQEVIENPFSGLKLSLPESAVPVRPSTPAQTSSNGAAAKTAAANAVLGKQPASNTAAEPTTTLEEDPFAAPAEPPAAKPSDAKATQSKSTTGLPRPELPTLSAPASDTEEDPFAATSTLPERGTATPTTPKANSSRGPVLEKPAVARQPAAVNKQAESKPQVVTKEATREPTKSSSKTVSATPARTSATKPAAPIDPKVRLAENLKRLANSPEKTGLKGFCPVTLRQKRELVEAKAQFSSTWQGKKYLLSSADAKATFEKQPHLYAPAHGGQDSVTLLDDKKSVAGVLDHAAWFQGRLYLFASRKNLEAFIEEPEIYVDDEEETTLTAKPGVKASETSKPTTSATSKTTPATLIKAPAGLPPVASGNAPKATGAANDEIPTLTEDFGDEPRLTPVEPPGRQPAVPAAIHPANQQPAAASKSAAQQKAPRLINPQSPPGGGASTNSAAPLNPRIDLPLMKKETKNTPASFVAPQTNKPRSAPPRLISPDLRLAPAPTATAPRAI